jgi:hypothetical protein
MSALAIALALSVTPAQAGPPQTPGAWAADVNAMGWTRVASAPTALLYVRAPLGQQKPGYPTIWIRYEVAPNQMAFLSSNSLEEFDCANGQERAKSTTMFAGRNMSGQNTPAPDAVWQPVQPGSMLSIVFAKVCTKP